MGPRRTHSLKTRQGSKKGFWDWTSTTKYPSTEIDKAAARLRADLKRDQKRARDQGREFYYRVQTLPPRRPNMRIKTRKGHAIIQEGEMTIKANSSAQAKARIDAAIATRQLTYNPASIRKVHDTELYAFTPVVLKKVK